MGCKCLICNGVIKAAPPGPASSEAKLKFKKDKWTGISKTQCKIFCKAMNIPFPEYSKEIVKFPVCPQCCNKVHKMTYIVKALERLQNTVRQFRNEVTAMLEASYDADFDSNGFIMKGEETEDALTVEETSYYNEQEMKDYAEGKEQGSSVSTFDTDVKCMKDGQNYLRKQIIDVLKNKADKSNVSEKHKKKTSTTTPLENQNVKSSSSRKEIKKEVEKQFLIEECKNRKAVVSLNRLDRSESRSDLSSIFPANDPVITKVTSQFNKSVQDFGVFHGVSFPENDSDDDDWNMPSSSPYTILEDEGRGQIGQNDFENEQFDIVPSFKLVRASPSPEPSCSTTDKVTTTSKPRRSARKSPVKVKKEDRKNDVKINKPIDSDGDSEEFQIDPLALDEEPESDSWDEEDIAPPKRRALSKQTKKSIQVERNFPCQKCNRSFRDDFDLQVHVRKTHEGNKKPFVCSWEGCEKSFEKKFKWKSHMEFHTTGNNIKKYVCPTCNKSYDCNNSLQRHMSNHTGKWKYPCILCNKGFHRPSELESHVKRHNNTTAIHCNFCDEKFLTSRMRIKHESLMHPDQDLKQNTRCEYCQKVFSSADTLRCHRIQLHTGEYNFHCDVCGKGFAKESWMVRHKLQHTQERNFPCDQCPEKFRFPNSLAAHKLKHLGKFPFQCRFCDKKFILRSSLNVHEPLHSKEKPFICEYCGKSFRIEYYMKHHIKRVHYKQVGLSAPPEYLKSASKRKKEQKTDLKPKTKPKEPKKRKQKLNPEESTYYHDGDNIVVENYMNDGSMVQVELIVEGLEDHDEKEYLTQMETENSEEVTQCIQQEVEVETQKIEIESLKVKNEEEPYVEIVVSEIE